MILTLASLVIVLQISLVHPRTVHPDVSDESPGNIAHVLLPLLAADAEKDHIKVQVVPFRDYKGSKTDVEKHGKRRLPDGKYKDNFDTPLAIILAGPKHELKNRKRFSFKRNNYRRYNGESKVKYDDSIEKVKEILSHAKDTSAINDESVEKVEDFLPSRLSKVESDSYEDSSEKVKGFSPLKYGKDISQTYEDSEEKVKRFLPLPPARDSSVSSQHFEKIYKRYKDVNSEDESDISDNRNYSDLSQEDKSSSNESDVTQQIELDSEELSKILKNLQDVNNRNRYEITREDTEEDFTKERKDSDNHTGFDDSRLTAEHEVPTDFISVSSESKSDGTYESDDSKITSPSQDESNVEGNGDLKVLNNIDLSKESISKDTSLDEDYLESEEGNKLKRAVKEPAVNSQDVTEANNSSGDVKKNNESNQSASFYEESANKESSGISDTAEVDNNKHHASAISHIVENSNSNVSNGAQESSNESDIKENNLKHYTRRMLHKDPKKHYGVLNDHDQEINLQNSSVESVEKHDTKHHSKKSSEIHKQKHLDSDVVKDIRHEDNVVSDAILGGAISSDGSINEEDYELQHAHKAHNEHKSKHSNAKGEIVHEKSNKESIPVKENISSLHKIMKTEKNHSHVPEEDISDVSVPTIHSSKINYKKIGVRQNGVPIDASVEDITKETPSDETVSEEIHEDKIHHGKDKRNKKIHSNKPKHYKKEKKLHNDHVISKESSFERDNDLTQHHDNIVKIDKKKHSNVKDSKQKTIADYNVRHLSLNNRINYDSSIEESSEQHLNDHHKKISIKDTFKEKDCADGDSNSSLQKHVMRLHKHASSSEELVQREAEDDSSASSEHNDLVLESIDNNHDRIPLANKNTYDLVSGENRSAINDIAVNKISGELKHLEEDILHAITSYAKKGTTEKSNDHESKSYNLSFLFNRK